MMTDVPLNVTEQPNRSYQQQTLSPNTARIIPEYYCTRHGITSFNTFCALCQSEPIAMPVNEQAFQYEPYEANESRDGEHIMMNFDGVNLAISTNLIFFWQLINFFPARCTG
jgi:hypothetical protein